MTPRERIVRILLLILARPSHYTRKELARKFNKGVDVIAEDINHIRNAGIEVEQEKGKYYRYYIVPDQQFKELKYLQSLSDSEKAKIGALVNKYFSASEAHYINGKLNSLYNFQQLGLRSLRRPALERIDKLETAKKEQKQVILENYRSNTSKTRNRQVEPFHIDPELDTLQAYDIESGDSKHFKLSRIERVKLTDLPWKYQGHHVLKPTDVFRIADKEQVMVHLRLDVQAYNLLVENYPKALSEIYPGETPDTYDFQSKVNAQFYGLMNFIMSNVEHIEILSPAVLKQKVAEKATAILEKMKKNEGVPGK